MGCDIPLAWLTARLKVPAPCVVQSGEKDVVFVRKLSNFLGSADWRVLIGGGCIVIRHLGGREQRIQRLQPECLRRKDAAEVPRHLLRQIFKRWHFATATEGALRH